MILRPAFLRQQSPPPDSAAIQTVIATLGMQAHGEGGFFSETDRDPRLVPSPFPNTAASTGKAGPDLLSAQRSGFDPAFRNTSTSIYYLLTPASPQGFFHRNRGRTVHTLHRGRGRYVIIHGNEPGHRVETFVVGQDIAAGERLQWIVEGGKFKASFLLPDRDTSGSETGESGGLLISETVIPGFEYFDHDFLVRKSLVELVGEEKAQELEWLVHN
ncbi:RmlC-like cupin domain-containing protein [Podospora aff. communis PSN243]|uniref:RmlC-like cupin domain-containing protein n=1 Tax=Podospora aff. communis PSN243 TaxID=3040156 RepID=A0AAV9GWT0_9PEZI|nr:RmlC-like cupin domain-containing protein [Podospora aff. communis PSN243]